MDKCMWRFYKSEKHTEVLLTVHDCTKDEAFNIFAQFASGYETWSEMMRSAFFSEKYRDVCAY